MNPSAMLALAKANEVRTYRKDVKAHLAAGDVRLSEVLGSENPNLCTMRVRDILLATPMLGTAKVRRILDANRISPTLRLQDFPDCRREKLLCALADNHPSLRGRI